MNKRKVGRKFSRKRDQRWALMRSLLTAFFEKEKMKTTLAKAKETSKFAEKLITKSKKDNLATRRALSRYFSDKITKKLVDDLGKRYKDRNGGYTRVIKTGQRKSDTDKMAIIELVK